MNRISNHRYEVANEVLFQEVNGEMVLLDLSSEQYFGLDSIGASIWQYIEAGKPIEEVIENLLREFDVGREQLESDVELLLEQLLSAGLITKHSSAT